VQSPEVAAYFNEMAQPGDLASVAPDRLFLLSQSTADQKMVAFRSWSEAQTQLDELSDSVAVVMYNPEHWDLTPEDEQQDLATTIQEFAAFAHDRGIQFMFAPDRQYAEIYLEQVAPYVDAVLLQGQRLQHDPQSFAAWVLGMAEVGHRANPDIQLFVQVGATRGTAEEMYTAIQTVASEIDGIAVWSMPRTLDILQEFVTMVRESPPAPPATRVQGTHASTPSAPVPTELPTSTPESAEPTTVAALDTPTVTPTVVSPTAAASVQGTGAAPTVPTSMPPAEQSEPGTSIDQWLMMVLLFVGGMGVGFVLGFFVCWGLMRGS
jgi:hypothetical protein